MAAPQDNAIRRADSTAGSYNGTRPAQPAAPQDNAIRRADSAAEAAPLRLEKWLRSVGYTEGLYPASSSYRAKIGFDPALILTIQGPRQRPPLSFFDTGDPRPPDRSSRPPPLSREHSSTLSVFSPSPRTRRGMR
ncbi:MAG: hypothetical protein IPK19_24610 [Chloroflexi bacterium]|nr:hypothetical protein [Chloroflexota bacterium]